MKNGIDLSHHNTVTDYKTAFSNIDFVMIRAGYGRDKRQFDKNFATNIRMAEKYNIPYGLYWYSYAKNQSDALQEAKTCCEILKGNNVKNTFPVFIDIEDNIQLKNTKATNTVIVTTFCEYLIANGYKCGFYTYHGFAQNYLDIQQLAKYDYWYANCTINDDTITQNYSIWQYTFKKKIDGIRDFVDGDKMSDTYFNRYAYKKPTVYDALKILQEVVTDKNTKHTTADALKILQEVIHK